MKLILATTGIIATTTAGMLAILGTAVAGRIFSTFRRK